MISLCRRKKGQFLDIYFMIFVRRIYDFGTAWAKESPGLGIVIKRNMYITFQKKQKNVVFNIFLMFFL